MTSLRTGKRTMTVRHRPPRRHGTALTLLVLVRAVGRARGRAALAVVLVLAVVAAVARPPSPQAPLPPQVAALRSHHYWRSLSHNLPVNQSNPQRRQSRGARFRLLSAHSSFFSTRTSTCLWQQGQRNNNRPQLRLQLQQRLTSQRSPASPARAASRRRSWQRRRVSMAMQLLVVVCSLRAVCQ